LRIDSARMRQRRRHQQCEDDEEAPQH
jgi:hypothetical protein